MHDGKAGPSNRDVRPGRFPFAKRYPAEVNAWVVIEPDDTVIIRYRQRLDRVGVAVASARSLPADSCSAMLA
jgi:hypothetical protein